MKIVNATTQFKRDAKKHYLSLITPAWAEVLNYLVNNQTLPERYRDHKLNGNLSDLRDCHIKPDLVLLYQSNDESITLIRLGTHSELGIA